MSENGDYLRRHPEFFSKPLNEGLAECQRLYEDVARRVQGANARLQRVMDEYKALQNFGEEVETHCRARSFHELPALKHLGQRLRGFHILTSGPWRGVFLIEPDVPIVIALIFSKHPHRMEENLVKIATDFRRMLIEETAADPRETDEDSAPEV